MHKPPDVSVSNHGTVYLLHLHTRRAAGWVKDHVSDDRQYFGNALAVEHRFIEDIVRGMGEDGLRVESN